MNKPTFLQTQQCCLYVIDPQERLMAHIHEADRVINNISLLLRLAGIMDMAVCANTQYKKGIGPIVPALTELLAGTPCPDKIEFNGLANVSVRRMFDGLPATVDTLIFSGVETHICVYQSAVGALQAGYRVCVAADAVSSRTAENNSFGRERLRELGCILAPTEMLIYEFLGQAGTPAFKAMLPYLK